ncbi:ABC transporter substrate-binding protein [Vibrio sp. ZSDE26]|uniref:ABC transporter substrate-binding protein n=1 Tax=Vibrio amylolyticus TaxID=2847292 RepID=A0A9X1XGY9_9VIBR|nr:ABC transporter substrate-binding protein [Vibrio amylolyticus]MCK6262962.1 ABC transporter substrate-binding protein [Vibrio amylolyticus]
MINRKRIDYFMAILLTSMVFTLSVHASPPEIVKVYFDSDRTGHIESAKSIEQGVKVAFSEVDNQLNGIPVEFVTLDHRGNALRSKKNMEKFLQDENALVYVAGLHSPPLIKFREFINESHLLTLVPWAAGSPITRYPSTENNYVFRLSVDDSKVGGKLVNHALDNGCQQPQLMLENTAWGQSNYKAMQSALPATLSNKVQVTWFDWGITDVDARNKIREAIDSNADCLLMVSNAREGRLLTQAVGDLEVKMPIYSHWGITGGSFANELPFEVREKADLQFIQSCFNFYSGENSEFQMGVFKNAQEQFPADFSDTNIAAPAGFIHGYDLAQVFIEAVSTVTLTNDMKVNRKNIKESLESFDAPVQGLIKQYKRPFSPYSESTPDAHEALTIDDLCMAMYDKNNAVRLLN